MKFIITEQQYKKLLVEETSDEIKTKMKYLSDFFKRVNDDLKETIGLDFQFSATWGLCIAGFMNPITRFIEGEFNGLTTTELSLIGTGVVLTIFYHNKKTLLKVLDKIKELGVVDAFKLALDKAKQLELTFRNFVSSFGLPLIESINMLAYSFIIPILPELARFAYGNSSLNYGEIIVRLLSYLPLKHLATLIKRLLLDMLKRFND